MGISWTGFVNTGGGREVRQTRRCKERTRTHLKNPLYVIPNSFRGQLLAELEMLKQVQHDATHS